MKFLSILSLISLVAVPTFSLVEERSPVAAPVGLQSRAACGAPCSSASDCGGSCPLCPLVTKTCTHIRRLKERSDLEERSQLLETRAGCNQACSTSTDCVGSCRLCAGGGTCHPPHKARKFGLVDKRDAALLDALLEERSAEAEAEPEPEIEDRSPYIAGDVGIELIPRALCGGACSSRADCAGSGCPLCIGGSCIVGP